MTFVEAIRVCFVKYADFSGCASKAEFWFWALFTFVASLALMVVANSLYWAFSIATFVPYLAVTTRRLHDVDKSGWWQLLALVPVLGWVLLLFWLMEDTHKLTRFSGVGVQREWLDR